MIFSTVPGGRKIAASNLKNWFLVNAEFWNFTPTYRRTSNKSLFFFCGKNLCNSSSPMLEFHWNWYKIQRKLLMNKSISISKIQKTYLHDLIPQFQDNIKLRLFHVSHPAGVLLPLLKKKPKFAEETGVYPIYSRNIMSYSYPCEYFFGPWRWSFFGSSSFTLITIFLQRNTKSL